MITEAQNENTSKKSQQIELRSKKTYFKIQCRPYQQKLAMSGLIFGHSSLLEHLVYYDPYEYVELSDCRDAYSQLKGVTYVWLGDCLPRETNLPKRIMLAKNLQELKQMMKKLREDQKLILFYIKESINHLNLKELDEMEQIIQFPIQNYKNIGKAVENSEKYTKGQLKRDNFPNFCLLSSDNKAEINKVKYNLYWMLAWQNFHQSRKDFLNFASFYYQRIGKAKEKKKEELHQLFQQYRSVFRNTKREIKLYTQDTEFHNILNNCLRVFQSPYDFAHIRFPFRHMFLTIVQLFIQQAGKQFRQKGFRCYRGCNLSDQEIKQLKDYLYKYIHVNGFVSASQKQDVAKKFGKYTIIIDVPPVGKNSSFFHCFAQVHLLSSFYQQFQIIFNPLNVYKVVSVQETTKRIKLEYVNVEKIPRQSDKLSEIDRSLVDNYDFQRNMVSLNRNQGQYLWKQWDHGAEKFYKKKITFLLKIVSQNLQPGNSMRKLSRAEQFFYKKIQEFARDFEWSDKQQQNLKIVDLFLDKFEYKASELHFHIGRYLQNQLDFLTSFVFLSISYSVTSRRFSKHSSFNYTIYTNVGIALAYLDQFRSAQRIFDIARVNFQSNLSNLIIYQSNYPFIIFVAVTFYQMGKMQKYKEVRQFMKNVIKATQKSQNTQNNHWLCLLDNLNQISQVQNFRFYFKVTFGRTNPYLKKMYIYCIQNVLQLVHQAELEDITKERAKKLFSDLCECSKILKAHDSNGDLQHDLVRMLLYLCNCQMRNLNLLWSFFPQAIDTAINQFEDYLEDYTIESFSYYKLKVYFSILKYSLRAKLQYPKLQLLKHFRFLQTILIKNYRKCYYLHYNFLTVLLQYYVRSGLLGQAVEVVKKIKIVKSKVDVMLVLDKQELRTILIKMKKKGMQDKVKSEKVVTCIMESSQKSG